MKTTYAVLPVVMLIALSMAVSGPIYRDDSTKINMGKHDMSSMMGKPTVDVTVEGLHMKIWLMSQKDRKNMMDANRGRSLMPGDRDGTMQMMKIRDTKTSPAVMDQEMKMKKHGGMGTGEADAMMVGTHHLGIDVTDATSGTEIAIIGATVELVSPSKKATSIELKPMMNRFAGALALDEKGEYRVTVSVNAGGSTKSTTFQYAVE